MPSDNLRSTPFDLTVRKETRFDFSELNDVVHTENNLYISHFFNALSLVTPITEGILIRAIREAKPLLKGNSLEADASAFIGQEAIHTREHRELNRRLTELGFDTQQIIDDIEEEVKELEGSMTLQERLALVVTGEHAIYSLSRALLTTGHDKSEQQVDVKNLFVWHALEEMEHQSVCDDIYRHLYGDGIKNKLLYFKIFVSANKLLSRMISKLMKEMMAQSRKPNKGEFNTYLLWLFHKPGIGSITMRELLAFFSPGFSHWSRRKEDQTLIQQGLRTVYETEKAI